jgi:hypothetical protein
MTNTHANIDAALCAVRKEIPYIQKVKPKGLNYEIVGIEDIISALRPALDKHEVTIAPVSIKVIAATQTARGEPSEGKVTQRVIAQIKYRLAHGPSGTEIHAVGIGEAADVGDKASIKAATAAYKVMLRQVLVLETGLTDPDTYQSQKSGSSAKRYDRARTALLGAKSREEFQRFWDKVLATDFNDEQMAGLRRAVSTQAHQFAVDVTPPGTTPGDLVL